VIGNLSSLVAAVAAVVILGQVMTALQIVGVGIGLTAIAVVALSSARAPEVHLWNPWSSCEVSLRE